MSPFSGIHLAGGLSGNLGTDYDSEENTALPDRRIWRLFGDLTGLSLNYIPDASVLSTDFAAFRAVFGTNSSLSIFQSGVDSNGNGVIDSDDFAQFRMRFGISI